MGDTTKDYATSDINYQTAQEENEFKLFQMLKPSLTMDGNQWCVLYGEDLQVGIAGFGDSPHLAIMDFTSQWYKSIKDNDETTSVNTEEIFSGTLDTLAKIKLNSKKENKGE